MGTPDPSPGEQPARRRRSVPPARVPGTKRSGGGRVGHRFEMIQRQGRVVIVFECGTGYNPRMSPRDNDGAPLCARCAARDRGGVQLELVSFAELADLGLFDLPDRATVGVPHP